MKYLIKPFGIILLFLLFSTSSCKKDSPQSAPAPVSEAKVPAAPSNVVVTSLDAAASVSFSPPSSDGGAAITNYIVTASGGIPGSGTTSPIVVPGLTNGKIYTFTVKAVNSVGSSPVSAMSEKVMPLDQRSKDLLYPKGWKYVSFEDYRNGAWGSITLNECEKDDAYKFGVDQLGVMDYTKGAHLQGTNLCGSPDGWFFWSFVKDKEGKDAIRWGNDENIQTIDILSSDTLRVLQVSTNLVTGVKTPIRRTYVHW